MWESGFYWERKQVSLCSSLWNITHEFLSWVILTNLNSGNQRDISNVSSLSVSAVVCRLGKTDEGCLSWPLYVFQIVESLGILGHSSPGTLECSTLV